MPEGWHVAMLYPMDDLKLPAGFKVNEVQDAGGITLSDEAGHTLYVMAADVAKEPKVCNGGPCSRQWIPYAAPSVGLPAGDFTTVARADGFSQWAYKGLPVYKFAGDFGPNLANGDGALKGNGIRIIWFLKGTELTIMSYIGSKTPNIGNDRLLRVRVHTKLTRK